jgi:hypothetical protein
MTAKSDHKPEEGADKAFKKVVPKARPAKG